MRLGFFAAIFALGLGACEAGPDHPRIEGGPPSAWTAYWTVPGFPEIPERGPNKAIGVIFWSHGVKGKEAQYQGAPPAIIRDLAQKGWDVVKINRNNLFENNWGNAGLKHVHDLDRRIGEAKAKGYKHVIAAGQSYGGAISLEVAKRRDDIFAVLAFSPAHGSDAATGASVARLYENLIGLTVDQIEKSKVKRIWVSLPSGDYLMPDEGRSSKARAALDRTEASYYLVDEDAPVRGHGAVATSQYRQWYGKCIQDIADPEKSLARGSIACGLPYPVPTFIYPTNVAIKKPADDLPSELTTLSGRWLGAFEDTLQEIEITFEDITSHEVTFVSVTGAGRNRTYSLGWGRYKAKIDGLTLRSTYGDGRPLALWRDPATDTLAFSVTTKDGGKTYRATLNRQKPR